MSFPKFKKLILISVLLSFVFLGLFTPFGSEAQNPLAFWGGSIANDIVSTFIWLYLRLSSFVVGACSWTLNWVLSEDFISWSYTGADNPIVKVGWGLTRDLANMFFVIALAFIGLAHALGLGAEYEAEKALPRLIFMAILLNFSRVICGLIIDASNILTYFFLGNFAGVKLAERFLQAEMAGILKTLGAGFNVVDMIQAVFQGLILFAFNLAYSLVLVLFILLFITRYVMLWLLVILSPIAFLSNALPFFEKIVPGGGWKRWWDLFLQWCFVGVTGAFFLYLGNHMLLEVGAVVGEAPATAGPLAGAWLDLIQSLIPYGVALLFNILGFILSMSTAPMGAELATEGAKWVKGQTIKRGKQAALFGPRAARRGARKIPGVLEAEEKVRKGVENIPLVGRMVGGPGAFERRRAEEIKEFKNKLKKIPDTDTGNESIAKRVESVLAGAKERAAGLEILAEREDLPNRMRKYLRQAKGAGADIEAILSKRPDWASEVGESVRSRIRKIAHNKARNIQPEALKEIKVTQNLNVRQIKDIRNEGSREQQRNITDALQEAFEKHNQMTLPSNRPFTPTGAFRAGISLPLNIDPSIWNYLSTLQTKTPPEWEKTS